MTKRPLPESPDLTDFIYEVDVPIAIDRNYCMILPLDEIEEFLWSRKCTVRLRLKPVIGHEDCYILRGRNGHGNPYLAGTLRARSIIAERMGLQPAAFCSFLPKYYDPDFHKRYRYSFSSKCKFDNRYCVRPSHLIPCTYHGRPLRP